MVALIFSVLVAMPLSSAFAGSTNFPPVLGEITDKTEDENDTIIITIDATDDNSSDTLTFTATGLPAFGQLVNTGDRMADLIFETERDSAGTYTITITVTDDGTPQLSDADTFTLTVLNDIEGELEVIDEAIDEVEDLADAGEINNGQATSLIQILENSIDKLESDKISTAISMMETFINKINALVISGQLDSDDGNSLIAEIQELIGDL